MSAEEPSTPHEVPPPVLGLPDPRAFGGLSPRMWDRLAPYLGESVIVLDARWQITANLSAPMGLLGWGDPRGTHVLAHVHPDDVLQYVDVVPGLEQTDPGWVGVGHIRMRRADGRYVPYEVTMHNQLEDPDVRGWVIRTREMAEPSEPTPELADRGLARNLADALPLGVIAFDGRAIPMFVNRAACDLLGIDDEAFAHHGLRPVLDDTSADALEAQAAALAAGAGPARVALRLRGDDDRRFEVVLSARRISEVLEGGSAEVGVIAGVIEDVTHHVRRQIELEDLAARDPLTGLRNRTWLVGHLAASLETGPVTVAYLDLCDFKSVNDELGHRAGDGVLASVAESIHRTFGEGNVARVGGDEFVVLGPAGLVLDHGEVADRARRAVAESDGAVAHGITASVGVVTADIGADAHLVLDRADQAMYADKRGD